jgi:hypothetical protein
MMVKESQLKIAIIHRDFYETMIVEEQKVAAHNFYLDL